MTENKRYVIEKEKQSCNDPDFLEFIEEFKKKDSFWIFIREITGNKEWDEDTPPLAFTLTFNTTEFISLEDELNELYNENEQLKRELDQFYLLVGRGDWSGLVDLIKGDLK